MASVPELSLKGDSKRAVHIHSRKFLEDASGTLSHSDADGDVFCPIKNTCDKKSTRPLVASLDKSRLMANASPISAYTLALERQSTTSLASSRAPTQPVHNYFSGPISSSAPVPPKHEHSKEAEEVFRPHRSRFARAEGTRFVMEMGLFYKRPVQSQEEIDFHHYLDFLEAEQRRGDCGAPGHDSYEESLDKNGWMWSSERQTTFREQVSGSHSSTRSASSLASTESLRLTRCRGRQAVLGDHPHWSSPDSRHQLSYSPEGIIWGTPDHPLGRGGPEYWWIQRSASRSGEVWERYNEIANPRRTVGDDAASTFTAHDEDLIEEDLVNAIDLVATNAAGKTLWTRCKGTLKRMFGRKKKDLSKGRMMKESQSTGL